MIDCKRNNPIYEEVLEEYYFMKDSIEALIDPKGLLVFDTIPSELSSQQCAEGVRAAYVITTVGKKLEEYSTKMFQQDAYLKGMLIDAIADASLYQMDNVVQDVLKQECVYRQVGILKRLEAPDDLPIYAQKAAFDKLKAGSLLGITISSGYMFNPAKTLCQIFLLSPDTRLFNVKHDCGNCKAINCKIRGKVSFI